MYFKMLLLLHVPSHCHGHRGGESSCKIHHENLVKLLVVKLTEDLAPQWFSTLKLVHAPVIREPGLFFA